MAYITIWKIKTKFHTIVSKVSSFEGNPVCENTGGSNKRLGYKQPLNRSLWLKQNPRIQPFLIS